MGYLFSNVELKGGATVCSKMIGASRNAKALWVRMPPRFHVSEYGMNGGISVVMKGSIAEIQYDGNAPGWFFILSSRAVPMVPKDQPYEVLASSVEHGTFIVKSDEPIVIRIRNSYIQAYEGGIAYYSSRSMKDRSDLKDKLEHMASEAGGWEEISAPSRQSEHLTGLRELLKDIT